MRNISIGMNIVIKFSISSISAPASIHSPRATGAILSESVFTSHKSTLATFLTRLYVRIFFPSNFQLSTDRLTLTHLSRWVLNSTPLPRPLCRVVPSHFRSKRLTSQHPTSHLSYIISQRMSSVQGDGSKNEQVSHGNRTGQDRTG